MSKELALLEVKERNLGLETARFELDQRQGKALSVSAFFPDSLKNDVASAVIIYDLAARMNISVMEVSQSIYIIHGKPSFATTFLVARLNQSGLIQGALRTVVAEDKQSAYCIATDTATGEEMKGMTVTMDMAAAEGWLSKKGSKWKTMPELMLRKRSQAFFIKEYYPQVMFGLQTQEESIDSDIIDVMPEQNNLNNVFDTKTEQPYTAPMTNPRKRLPKYITKYYFTLEQYGVKKSDLKNFVGFMGWESQAKEDIEAFFSDASHAKDCVNKFYGIDNEEEDVEDAVIEEVAPPKTQEASQGTMATETQEMPKKGNDLARYNGMFISRGIRVENIPEFLQWAGVDSSNIAKFVGDLEAVTQMTTQFLIEYNYDD